MAEAMYAAASAAQQQAGGAGPEQAGPSAGTHSQQPPKDGTMDADFTVVDDGSKN